MQFWPNNRLDAQFELEPRRVVALFRESRWWTTPWSLDRSLPAFLTDADGPISAVWDDDDAYQDVYRLALEAGWGTDLSDARRSMAR
jgi:hypothetical protein